MIPAVTLRDRAADAVMSIGVSRVLAVPVLTQTIPYHRLFALFLLVWGALEREHRQLFACFSQQGAVVHVPRCVQGWTEDILYAWVCATARFHFLHVRNGAASADLST